jgi:VWFA-related protein
MQESPSQSTPEISQHDETPTFKVKVSLVEVRVVVRDAKGKAIGNLKQEDFQLLDNGKPEVISKFSVERSDAKPPAPHEEPGNAHEEPGNAEGAAAPSTVQPLAPSRYIAYLFDDIHLQVSDLAQARNAAARQIQQLQLTDRAAIYTTSGQVRLDFTDDHPQLIATLNRIVPHTLGSINMNACENISYFMADAIQNRNDQWALKVAVTNAETCGNVAINSLGVSYSTAYGRVQDLATRVLQIGDDEIRLSLASLQDVVRHIATMPGQRIVILVSPGFTMNIHALPTQSEIADRALHSGIVINALDPAGLYTHATDASEEFYPVAGLDDAVRQYHIMELQANRELLTDLTDATGGLYFHGNNDLNDGFRRLTGPPEFSYLLGFSPENLKTDGKYHKLKVTLKPPAAGAIQARKGYFAPNGTIDASEQGKLAIQDAVFSQEEVSELPVQLHTQFFKPDEENAKLSVLVHMDVRRFHFRKADGRNNDDVTVVSALFDRNGNFISGTQKVLQMHLKDETLQSQLNSGVTLRSSFDVKPGRYIVRLVVRDADGQLAAQSSAVEIP